MIRMLRPIALAAAALAGATGGAASGMQAPTGQPAAATPSAEQLRVARVAGMHMAATLLFRGVKGGVASGTDVRQLFHEPEGIALWAAAIPGLFPAGSGGGDSRARPEIWTNRADFEAKASDLRAAANRLLQLSRAGDAAGYAAQADAVEAACNACHMAYRDE
jgi:cytochrome c556